MDTYDAGLLNDYGGGDVGWWQDYLRAELGRAEEFYRDQHDRLMAEKRAEIARLLDAARDVVRAYQEANPMRQADMHPASCGCLRCEIDRLGNACGRDPCGALDAAAIRAMKGERG